MTNAEGYQDPTADLAVGRTQRRARINSVQAKARKVLDKALQMMKKEGFRIDGTFKVVEESSEIFLKVWR